MDEPITIEPNLTKTNRQRRPVRQHNLSRPPIVEEKPDPDVERVLKQKCDVVKMKHNPTEEEKSAGGEEVPKPASKWTWVVIGLALIVVVLMIAIAWYVLKENKKDDQSEISPYDVQPMSIPDRMVNAVRNGIPNIPMPGMGRYSNPVHPSNRPQTEQMPIQTSSMPIPRHELAASKTDLQKTLARMNTIKEECVGNAEPNTEVSIEPDEESDEMTTPPIVEEIVSPRLKPSDLQRKKEEADSHENNIDDDDEMSKKFNSAVLGQVEMDEDDSDEEEQ